MFNDGKAAGYYAEAGWYIGKTDFEIDLRYDSYTRDEFHPSAGAQQGIDETSIDTITVGAQYHFNKKTRLNVEYASRDAESNTAVIEGNVKGINDRFAIQVTHIF